MSNNDTLKNIEKTVSPTCTNCGEKDALKATLNPFKSFRRTRECKECGEPFRLTTKQWIAQIIDELFTALF